MHAKPYEIRPMSVAEILDAGFRLVRDHFALLVGIQLLIQLPLAILQQLSGPGKDGAMKVHWEWWGAFMLANLLVMPIANAAVTWAIGQAYVGRRVSLTDSVRRALAIIVPLSVTTLLTGLAFVGGLVLFVVPGIYVIIRLLPVWPVVVMEQVSGTAAIKRTWKLTEGHGGRLFAVALATWLLSMVVGGVVGTVTLVTSETIGPLLSAFAASVGAAYGAAVQVVQYYEIRCRAEAFDIEHLARLVEAGAMAEAPVPHEA